MTRTYIKALRAIDTRSKETLICTQLSQVNSLPTSLSNEGQTILNDIKMLLENPLSREYAEQYLPTAIEYIGFQILSDLDVNNINK